MNITDFFQYEFAVRGLVAGVMVGLIAPLIGLFLVLRRYSLIADTLAHVSLAGVAVGFLTGINPVWSAIIFAVLSSVAIERIRLSKRVYGESALAMFLSGSLALAVVLISVSHGFNSSFLNYLFGSIVTVKQSDLYLITGLGVVIIMTLSVFYKELVYITFDEESARVSGIPTKVINMCLVILGAMTVSLSIPIVGVLLISALMVIPVITALQFRQSFVKTILLAECLSLVSVVGGVLISFFFNLSTGGTIVLISLALFMCSWLVKRK